MGKWHNYNGSQSNKDRKAISKLRRDILTAIHKAHTVRCYRDDNGTFKNVVSGFMRLDELDTELCHDDDGVRIVSDVAFQNAIDWLQKTGRISTDTRGWLYGSYDVVTANPSLVREGAFFDDYDWLK